MSAKWQKLTVKLPDNYGPTERMAVGIEIIKQIRDRTKNKNVDKDGSKFPKYSDAYIKSLDFKVAGKSKGKIDLTLSGDMLGAMKILDHKKGAVTVGFEKGSDENARADGNIRGTYGGKSSTGKKRDFLGVSKKELDSILKKYPVKDPETANERAERLLASDKEAKKLAKGIETEEEE